MEGASHQPEASVTPLHSPEGGERLVERPFKLEIVGPDHPDFAVAEEAEARIFDRAFHNSAEVMDHEYGPYRSASEFIVVKDQAGERIAGVMRLIKDSAAGFKSLNDLETGPWHRNPQQVLAQTGLALDPATTIDIATLGIEEGYRAQDQNPAAEGWVSLALYHGLCRYSSERNIRHWVAILDDRVLGLVQQIGHPFETYPDLGSAHYLDSPASTPVWSDYVAKAKELYQQNPEQYAMIVQGIGLEKAVDLPSDHNSSLSQSA